VVVGVGMVVLATGLAAIALVSATTSMWGITAITLLMGTGIGSVMAPATDSIMGSVSKEKAGVGSAMNDTTRQAGGAIGVAVLGSVLASKFRTTMSAQGRAHHLPGAVIAATRSDVATAQRVARTPLGARYATVIESTARSSFMVSLHLAALIGAAVVLLAGLGIFKWLPARASDETPVTVVDRTAALVGTGVVPAA
jgi:hypothetical protein